MAKLGSKEKPAVVHVETMDRAGEIMSLCDKNNWQVIVGIEPDKPEDISDIERLLNPPKPVTKAITIERNEPCPCGSGKKYKHCCLN
jgi:SWIM/SEC-C metal-binding protein